MKADINYVVEETNRLKLIAPQWYLTALNSKSYLIDSIANGCGSETMGIFYHLVPDTIYFKNINSATHPHDMEYTYPLNFPSVAEGLAWKRKADFQFKLNVEKIIRDRGGIFKYLSLRRLKKYCFALECAGTNAFWCNKKPPSDFYDYYSETPDFNINIYNKYEIIWEEICGI